MNLFFICRKLNGLHFPGKAGAKIGKKMIGEMGEEKK